VDDAVCMDGTCCATAVSAWERVRRLLPYSRRLCGRPLLLARQADSSHTSLLLAPCRLSLLWQHDKHHADVPKFLLSRADSSLTDLLLAPRRMAPVSSISAMNVDTPRAWQSPAPTRAKMASRGVILALSAGTKQPTWAMSTRQPTCARTSAQQAQDQSERSCVTVRQLCIDVSTAAEWPVRERLCDIKWMHQTLRGALRENCVSMRSMG
jgi:hypothetical protein